MFKQDYEDIDAADPSDAAYVAQLVADLLEGIDPALVPVEDVMWMLAELAPDQQVTAGYLLRDAGVPMIVVLEALERVSNAVVVEDSPPVPPSPPVVVLPPPITVTPPRRTSGWRILFGVASTAAAIGIGYAVGKRYGRRL